MTNAEKTTEFFKVIDEDTKLMILKNIANHYGVPETEILKEVTHPEAEHLLDYVTGPERAIVHLFMKNAGPFTNSDRPPFIANEG